MSDAPERTARALVSTTTAARALGVSQPTLSRWAAAGLITPAQRTLGGHMRWDLAKLRAELQERGAISPDD